MDEAPNDVMEPRLWQRLGWTAKVVRNEEDHGWAVEMTRIGDSEPALVGPWTMGRDKKNPKPLDAGAFTTLIKTANDVIARHEQSAQAMLKKRWTYRRPEGDHIRVELDLVPNEDDPHGELRVYHDFSGELLREGKVSASFKLSISSVEHFITAGD